MITIYNFTTPGSNVFANIGWCGMLGSLAGFSPLIGIGERKWDDEGMAGVFGTPWMYVLRDTL